MSESTHENTGTNKLNTSAPMAFKNKIVGAEHSLERMSHDAGHRVGALAKDFAATTSDYVESSRQYVKENPATSLAIAASAGVIAGGLISMAMRQR